MGGGTIDSLRARSGFARSTVAEAIRLLADRGLAEIRPGHGGGLFATAAGPMVKIRHTLLAVTDAPTAVAEAGAVREALEVLIDVDAAKHRTAADIADMKKLLAKLKSAAAKGRTTFLLANWDLHERIALISPNQTASALYLSMTRFVREHAVAVAVLFRQYHTNRSAVHSNNEIRLRREVAVDRPHPDPSRRCDVAD